MNKASGDDGIPVELFQILKDDLDINEDGKITEDEYFYNTKNGITDAIALGKYPSPPARDLYLVSKGVPTNPVVVEFLKYVLSKGQDKNEPVGYIRMNDEKIQANLDKLQSK